MKKKLKEPILQIKLCSLIYYIIIFTSNDEWDILKYLRNGKIKNRKMQLKIHKITKYQNFHKFFQVSYWSIRVYVIMIVVPNIICYHVCDIRQMSIVRVRFPKFIDFTFNQHLLLYYKIFCLIISSDTTFLLLDIKKKLITFPFKYKFYFKGLKTRFSEFLDIFAKPLIHFN